MRFSTALCSLAAGAALFGAAAADEAKCTTILDRSSPLYQVLPLLNITNIDDLPLEKVLKPIDDKMPWLTKCLGSANVNTVGLGVMSDPEQRGCLDAFKNRESSLGFSNTFFTESICPLMEDAVIPCSEKLVVKLLNTLMDTTPCCDDMRTKLTDNMGGEIDQVIPNLARQLADVMCSTKTYMKDGNERTDTCGYALMDTVGSGKVLVDISKMFQLPNDQACVAMQGEEFKSSSGDVYKFFDSQIPGWGQIPLDVCFAPLNNLLTSLAEMPMWGQLKEGKLDMTDMFADGKCVKGQSILDWAAANKGFVETMALGFDELMEVATEKGTIPPQETQSINLVIKEGIKSLEDGLGKLCFHIPNGVDDCEQYSGKLTYVYSKAAPPSPTQPGDKKEDGESAPNPSNAVMLAPATALVFAASLILSYAL